MTRLAALRALKNRIDDLLRDLDPESGGVFLRHASRYLHPSRPPFRSLYSHYQAEIDWLNFKRDMNEDWPLEKLSQRTFRNTIHCQDPYLVHAARHGEKSASAMYRPSSARG